MRWIGFACICCVLLVVSVAHAAQVDKGIALPKPQLDGPMSLEKALKQRRSIRRFADKPITLKDVGQLLWAAQGISDYSGHRTAPSAGATYPLVTYLVAGNVDGLSSGVYRYDPKLNSLELVKSGDKRALLGAAAFGQSSLWQAPAILVLAAVYERTTKRYKERGRRYVHMEVGHAAQNVYLQCQPLALGTVTVGAFQDFAVRKVLGMSSEEVPMYLMPIGKI